MYIIIWISAGKETVSPKNFGAAPVSNETSLMVDLVSGVRIAILGLGFRVICGAVFGFVVVCFS